MSVSGYCCCSLFLNIWAPSTATWKKPVPVMVWLYGGAFQQGGTSKVEVSSSSSTPQP